MNPIHYKGKRVIKSYGKQTSFIIAEIDFDQNPMSKFSKFGKEMTYVSYYKTCYQI